MGHAARNRRTAVLAMGDIDLLGDPIPAPPVHTERSMLDRLNARYHKPYRNGATKGVRFIRAEHVSTSAGFVSYAGQDRIADYIAVDMFQPPAEHCTERELEAGRWQRANGSIHGHEVKVSRSDWLSELRDPTKAERWMRHCHHWWLVAPRDVVRNDLPDGWGLLVPQGESLRIAVRAPRRDPEPMEPTMVASLMRAAVKTEKRIALEPQDA